jgi:putative YphP/YqiW family bacilliredoxin
VEIIFLQSYINHIDALKHMHGMLSVEQMREELTSLGVKELKTPQEVEQEFKEQKGTALLFFNSVCGCAAGNARPAVKLALQNNKKPEKLFTVFAGQDKEATMKAREYIKNYPPSSPSIALFKDGEVVSMIERSSIEGRTSEEISADLKKLFDEYC